MASIKHFSIIFYLSVLESSTTTRKAVRNKLTFTSYFKQYADMQKKMTAHKKTLTMFLDHITNIKLMLCFAVGEHIFSRTKQPGNNKLLNTRY